MFAVAFSRNHIPKAPTVRQIQRYCLTAPANLGRAVILVVVIHTSSSTGRCLKPFASHNGIIIMERIYLDNAATSWPKPESVYAAVDHAQRVIGSPAGRGTSEQAVAAMRLVEQTRGLVAELINAPDRRNISFTFNGTDSLSAAIMGLLKKGDHVVTSVVEHNSVLRPLTHLESQAMIETTFVGCDPTGTFDQDEVIAAIRPETRLVCLIHASNVTGSVQPIENIKRRILGTGNDRVLFLLDAAQSLGHLSIDVQKIGCDILAAPGHKAMLGPLGTGVLYIADNVSDQISPFRFGGTGSVGSAEFQPTKTPEKFEAGNLNVPGIAGLNAGIKFLTSEEGIAASENLKRLSKLILEGVDAIDGVKLQGLGSCENRVGVFSLSIEGFGCHEAAGILDSSLQIQSRAGIHCAPLLHRALGTEEGGGTLRLSPGLFNTTVDIEKALEVIAQITG